MGEQGFGTRDSSQNGSSFEVEKVRLQQALVGTVAAELVHVARACDLDADCAGGFGVCDGIGSNTGDGVLAAEHHFEGPDEREQ